MRARFATLIVAAAGLGLGGCAYGGLGGYGGYGGVSVGYGDYGYGGYGYGSPYYGYGYSRYGYNPYGYGGYYGSPYYGWYNGYYYPGSGYYVYDRHHNRRQLTDAERKYWTDRLRQVVQRDGNSATSRTENWSGFTHPDRTTRSDTRVRTRATASRPARVERVRTRERSRPAVTTRSWSSDDSSDDRRSSRRHDRGDD
ncbi:MAG TPA: hypothetical protein VFP53_02735 [Sphingomicrobium sp.]|nr:hypothetical protein [Sphingomicrobium sp.]